MVKTWVRAGRMMRFNSLDSSGGAYPAFTIGWRIIDDGTDVWTRRFMEFKNGSPNAVAAATAVLTEGVEDVLAALAWRKEETGLATALGSAATGADKTSALFRTGGAIAKAAGIRWGGEIFTKKQHRSLHSLTGRLERDDEVAGKYACSEAVKQVKNLLILDDLITRGATIRDMQRAAMQHNPKLNVAAIALGKNERREYAKQHFIDINNDHVPKEWDDLWKRSAQ